MHDFYARKNYITKVSQGVEELKSQVEEAHKQSIIADQVSLKRKEERKVQGLNLMKLLNTYIIYHPPKLSLESIIQHFSKLAKNLKPLM